MKVHHFKCCQCKQEKSHVSEFGVGYARKSNGHKVCYLCCGITDRQHMIEKGEIYLYLTKEFTRDYLTEHEKKVGALSPPYQWFVTNWPGTYKVQAFTKEGNHNWWGVKRQDIWFAGPDGFEWYGRLIGENNECFKARRTKVKRTPVHGIVVK